MRKLPFQPLTQWDRIQSFILYIIIHIFTWLKTQLEIKNLYLFIYCLVFWVLDQSEKLRFAPVTVLLAQKRKKLYLQNGSQACTHLRFVSSNTKMPNDSYLTAHEHTLALRNKCMIHRPHSLTHMRRQKRHHNPPTVDITPCQNSRCTEIAVFTQLFFPDKTWKFSFSTSIWHAGTLTHLGFRTLEHLIISVLYCKPLSSANL